MRVVILLALLAAAVCGEKARYDNYSVYRVTPYTQAQLDMLLQLQENPDGLSFWKETHAVGQAADVMVPPHRQPEMKEGLTRSGFSWSVYIQNVQENIDNEGEVVAGKAMDWTSYHRLADIHGWLDELIASDDRVTGIDAGTSFEGRPVRGVLVKFPGAGPKPGVFIEGGIHAREWISPATVTWILNTILSSDDARVQAYDWHVFPSTNPDGYEYCHTNDRLWRKTRSNSGGLCFGADPNRNWGFHWLGGGSSTQPCSDTYAGSAAFSESETRGLSNYIDSVASTLKLYLAFHSYSQFILIPYGVTVETVPNRADHDRIGAKAKTAIGQRYGTNYVAGNIVDLLYVASGGSMDWAIGTHQPDIKIAFTFELRDTGNFGFVLPPAQILPTAEETYDAVLSILEDTLALP